MMATNSPGIDPQVHVAQGVDLLLPHLVGLADPLHEDERFARDLRRRS